MKKLLLFVLMLLPMMASAADERDVWYTYVDGIFYSFNSENYTATVTCRGLIINYEYNEIVDFYSGNYSGAIEIPSEVTYNNVKYKVTSIGERAFSYCSSLTSVIIPNSVSSIADWAFINSSALTSIIVEDGNMYYDSRNNCNAIIDGNNQLIVGCKNTIIPNSVTSIGSSAFYGCSGLISIIIPKSVTSIGSSAFSVCSGLTSVTIPNSVTSIGDYAFSDCSGLTSVTIPNSVTSIESSAFSGCRSLASISIPNSVTSIGVYAFSGCSGLTSVTIPNSLTSIGVYAFSGCSGLTSVTIPNSVTSIGFDAFSGTAWYNNQPDGLVYTGKVAYKYKGEMPANTHITIKDGTIGITSSVFSECIGLTSITIPNSVTSIGDYAFLGCSGLTSVTIPNSVTSIGKAAFSNCSCLTSVTIGNSVRSIGNYTFSGCSGLTSLTIPNSVTSIGWTAFSGCNGLTSVIIGKGVKSIGDAFYNCNNLKEMILPHTTYENGIPASVTKFTTYSKNPMRVVVTSKGATSATMNIYPIDDRGNTNEDNHYTVTMQGLAPGQYITWKLDDENYGIISEKTNALALEVQPAKPTSKIKARLLATVNELDDDLHFGFEWLRYDAPSNMTPNKVSAPLYEGQIVGSLNNLNPDVYYKYRPYYKSEDGSMFYGEWESFITGDADVFFEPETHTKDVVEVTSASAQLVGVWIEGTEDIEEKGFEYWTVSGGNTRAVGKDVKTVVVSGNKMSVTIEGLIPGKNYGYRSYIKTVSGKTYGEEKTFKTILAGDVNGDGMVNDADVKDVASHIIGMTPKGFNKDAADVNNDNKVNAADIVLINKIINKK